MNDHRSIASPISGSDYVLVAEDDLAHAEAIRRALQHADPAMTVQVEDTLAAFRRQTAATCPKIAIVDLNMPDGLALEILTDPPEQGGFPILIMTSHGTEQMAVAALKAGALDYMVKSPEAFAELPRTVTRVLREWDLRRERRKAGIRIRHLNEVLHTLRGISQLILREKDPLRLIQQACDLMVMGRSYGGALIVLLDDGGQPGPTASAGFAAAGETLVRDMAGGHMPACFVQAHGKAGIHVIEDLHPDCTGCPIVTATPCTHRMCVPLTHQASDYGYLAVSVHHPVATDPEEQKLFAGMAADLAYALHNLAARQTIQAGEEARRALEAQLYQAQKMEAVGRVVGGVAHDFNNLLSIIMGYTDVVLDDLDAGHPHREPLDEIRDAALRARNLTRQLLAFSRKQVLEMEVLNLNGLVTGFEKLLRRVIGEDIALVLELAPTSLKVNADTSQLEQVLMNLAVNARDAMPDGGTLTIETGLSVVDDAHAALKPGVAPGDYATLRVSDTGTGMSRETLERLFEPFFSTKDRDKGTGLGLATSYG
ncbi:MAG: response regulator, partial [Desulfatitalea sp.]|nr:response regulator [Desulfatitalea sp.]